MHMPFVVPDSYFTQLPGRVMGSVKSAASLTVPAGYFENLAGRLLARINDGEAANEIAALAPNLHRIGKQMPYQVPAGYFAQFVAKPIVAPKKTAILRSIQRVTSWAVAACLIVLLGFTLWTFVGSPVAGNSSAEEAAATALASLPDDAFSEVADGANLPTGNSLQVAMGWKAADKALENFSADELQSYLQNSGLEELYNN